MKRTFAALRFCEDENIAGNVYWYLCEIRAAAGDRVLAPVGAHNRLQCARVERIVTVEEENAPYDLSLIKRVERKYGMRGVQIGEYRCRDFGGLCYDGKRYTRFFKAFYSDAPPNGGELNAMKRLGVAVLRAERLSTAELLSALSKADGCALVCGEGATEMMKTLFAILRGAQRADVDRQTLALLKNKFL